MLFFCFIEFCSCRLACVRACVLVRARIFALAKIIAVGYYLRRFAPLFLQVVADVVFYADIAVV